VLPAPPPITSRKGRGGGVLLFADASTNTKNFIRRILEVVGAVMYITMWLHQLNRKMSTFDSNICILVIWCRISVHLS
jgi:hypothetical protein